MIARITGIAEILNNKKALYDRAKAISDNGSIPAKRLEGMIDVLKTRLSSALSNWYTDENGNLILEAANGGSVMKLCGEGFMIANQKNDDGSWDWRTFGTGEGFSADLMVAGFLSADRIQSHSITANHLAADVGQSLDLSSNTSIRLSVQGQTGFSPAADLCKMPQKRSRLADIPLGSHILLTIFLKFLPAFRVMFR